MYGSQSEDWNLDVMRVIVRNSHELLVVKGEELDDLVELLSEEIYNNHQQAKLSTQKLNDLLCDHLINMNIVSSESDAHLISESIFEDLQQYDKFKSILDEESEEDRNSDQEYEDGQCVMCERFMPLTFHHLIPRETHEKYLKKGYAKKHLNKGIMVCRPCHNAVHRLCDNFELAEKYDTLDKLMDTEKIQKWVNYAMKQRSYSKDHALLNLKYSK